MNYGEREKLEATEALLKETGFEVSQICCSRPSCFDLAARKGENLVFVKFQPDIDSFSPSDSLELRDISDTVSATSLLISEKARENPLEDDTVYSRHNIRAVSPRTFENIMIRQSHPLIQAGPGGYYVEIDGGSIKRRRQELDLSVGEMAEMIGISRRTLYGYERGMAKASVTATYNLIYTLGIPVAKTVNIFERKKNQRKCRLLAVAGQVIAKNKLLTKIFNRSDRYSVTTVRKAPFDFLINMPTSKMRIMGGVTNSKEQELDRRIDEIKSVSRIVKAHPVLITDGREFSDKDISCVCAEELSKIKNLEDLITNFT